MLTGSYVYGVSVWGIKVNDQTKQQNLIITPSKEAAITVVNIKVAQFIYLLLLLESYHLTSSIARSPTKRLRRTTYLSYPVLASW
jgi:hypothetical protein